MVKNNLYHCNKMNTRSSLYVILFCIIFDVLCVNHIYMINNCFALLKFEVLSNMPYISMALLYTQHIYTVVHLILDNRKFSHFIFLMKL